MKNLNFDYMQVVFSSARVAMMSRLENAYQNVKWFSKSKQGTGFDLICSYADLLTAYNELFPFGYFVKFNQFAR